MVVCRHFLCQVGPVPGPAEPAIDPVVDDCSAAGRIRGDECLAHAPAFQQAKWHAFPVGRQDDTIGLFDERSDLVGMAKIGDQVPVCPIFHLLPGNGDRVTFVEKTQ